MHPINHCEKYMFYLSNLAEIGLKEKLISFSLCVVIYAHNFFFK